MMSSSFATHLFAVGLGVLVAAVAWPANSKEPLKDREESLSSNKNGPTNSRQRPRMDPRSSHPRVLLEAAMLHPMESHHRIQLVKQLRMDWAKDDPREFLKWQRDRTISKYDNIFVGDALAIAIQTLAKEDPAWLLAYARQCGDSRAIWALASHGDPVGMFTMCLDVGEAQWPDEWVARLFNRGAEIDPEFHLRIFDLQSPELRAEAARGFSDVMLATSRHASYAEWLAEHADDLPMKALAEHFGAELATSELDPSAILALPRDFQQTTVDWLLQTMAEHQDSFDSTQMRNRSVALEMLYDLGLLAGNEAVAATIVSGLSTVSGRTFHAHNESTDAAEWKTWAQQFPAEGPASVIREQALKNWIKTAPTAWREIAATAPPETSEILHAQAASNLPGDEGRLAAEQIVDPDLRAQVERYRAWEAGSDGDPFYENPEPAPWLD